jgi:F1F0 ATPase subunit 2
MKELTGVVLALFAGGLLGMVFFGGLWWTIQRGVSSKSPAILFSGSLLLRTATAVAGFYFVSQGDWRKLMACLLGFLLARMFVTRLTRVPFPGKTRMVEEGGR